MSFEINKSVKWVGKIDWELKKFHGDELSTHRGSSYNSYLVRDKKTALIDCVWAPFAKEFVANLKKEIDLNSIDYIIANHGEPDHSGALPELMREIPNTPIYCTANAIKSLKGQYHQDWNFIPVKTGDKLSLGSKEFIFIEARMLHWPDTMFTYLTSDNILFSNDGFGQHLASEHMFNDLVNQADLYHEAQKYYANILTPFSKMVVNKITEILSFNLPVDMICPSHGLIWRDNPLQIVDKYMAWAKDYQENQISIIYDTMWNSTRKMAEQIAAGIKLSDKDVTVKLFNCNSTHTDKNDIITEVFKSKAILVGSPTINKGISFAVAGILEMIKGLALKNKKGAAFGSYGWSGENTKLISTELEHAKFELLNEGLRVTWNPDDESLIKCQEFGRTIGEALK
ncbi:anaerobic nitric oxide reductase flavorubredoxin [Desulfosporosinus sp. BICA1-9]|uniref:anaerobic nitric oxide reductase flavorubredoxin n=1 Tax=Desulfosporosinus sp. BICA1-9 TaxID=1531958 RepID=UPI00054C78D2|nr:anaerobic nitric oxide reductase flavorubredoxin [Desulfosporosinus sp. BICA1-9]KJS49457.1 MAG: metallo-beta-lactamase [Peptococcaceae bacterium BRH_c23]KJS89246.1 MAG: metallo-beta-lactamase [Desulfosporosinus sp. BICA1-9]HBW35398.1 FprA family A-type flavoprotein [Desulfosporosinus sp.]